jgi:Transcription factor WhiB
MTDREGVLDTGRYKRGRVEGDRLTRALMVAASRGQRPNCSDAGSWMWTAEDDHARAQAALLCHDCVVFESCGEAAAARQETWSVWGFSVRPGRPKPQAE